MVWTLLTDHSPVILLDMHMSTIASLASRTGSTGSAAAAAFTILRLPALWMLVLLLSEAEAAAPGAPPHTRTTEGFLLASLLHKDINADNS